MRDGEDVRDGEVSSVADYATAIQINWQRSVDALLSTARLCAEAGARLTTAQKLELIQVLPFGQTTFSKFVQIGTDTRLNAPDIKRLLPPHYTMLYAVTSLTDEELKQSIAEKVIHPDMKRDDVQKWRNSRQRLASSPKESESDTAVASPAIASTQDAVESDALPSTMRDDNRDQQQLAAAPEEAAPEAAATAPAGQLTPQPSDEAIPAFLDRRPLSPEDQCEFDVIMAAYNIASPVVRERVRAEIIGANNHRFQGRIRTMATSEKNFKAPGKA